MGKTIKILRITALIIILVELVLGSTFAILYFYNTFNLQNYIDVGAILVGCFTLVALDCLFIWIAIAVVSSLKQKNELRAAEIIGEDIQEAYNFGQIGLVITDENNLVLWTNDLLRERHIDIIDSNIIEWQPELEKISFQGDNEETAQLVINSRTYDVKYIMEAGLWIFKDVSNYEDAVSFSRSQAIVIGVLTIDNYDNVVRGQDDFNDTVSKVKTTIFNYAQKNGLLIKRIKDDNYFIICNYASFEKVKEDHFSIIDTVRRISKDEGAALTLSIGFAFDFPDVNKLHEIALNALDVSMSRGGDQVVVHRYGYDMQFYGGKSEAQEKRSRVQMRVYADSLFGLIQNASNVLIMGHTQMDMDAFGACLGLKAICDNLKKPSRIIVDKKATESKTRSCLNSTFSNDELEKIIVSPHDAASLIKLNTLLIVADVHTPSMVMCPTILDEVSKIVVIDHHRRAEEYIDSLSLVFNHIDPSSSSTCEIIAEFIKFASINPRIELPAQYATIMLSGIFLDSGYFKSRSTGIRTFEAATILKEFGADNSMADDYLKDDYEEHKEIAELTQEIITPEYGVVVACGSNEKIYDDVTIPKAANVLLSYKGNHASFVIGRINSREVKISARSDGSINVQLLTEKLGGGGHFAMSAATIQTQDIEEVKKSVINVIQKHLKDSTNNYGKYTNEEA